MGSVGVKQSVISTPFGEFKNLDDVEKAVRKELGITTTLLYEDEREENRAQTRELFQEQQRLEEQLQALREEREKEFIPSDDPDVLALGKAYASMFGKYTERGQELREQMRPIEARIDEIRAQLDKLRSRSSEIDRDQRDLDRRIWKDWYGAPYKPVPPVTAREIDRSYKLKGEGFDSTTATSNIQDAIERGDAFITYMSPKEYIQRVAFDIFNNSVDASVRGTDWDNVVKYAKEMKSGTRYYMPWLDYANKGQEGRHRALAAILNGYERIPVAVRVR